MWHFDTIKQILKSNDSIKFDLLVLAERSGKCDNFFPKLKDNKTYVVICSCVVKI